MPQTPALNPAAKRMPSAVFASLIRPSRIMSSAAFLARPRSLRYGFAELGLMMVRFGQAVTHAADL